MELPDYKPNSNLSKQQQNSEDASDTKTITTNRKKQSSARRFAEIFTPNNVESVKENFARDVVGPAVMRLFHDVLTSLIDSLFGGGTYRVTTRNDGELIKYNRSSSIISSSRSTAPVARIGSVDDIVFDSLDDARYILNKLKGILRRDKLVKLSEYWTLCGQVPEPTYFNYGWTNLDSAVIIKVHDPDRQNKESFVIQLPKPMPVDYDY